MRVARGLWGPEGHHGCAVAETVPLLGPRGADHHRAALHNGSAGRGHGQAAVCGGGRKREHPMVQVRLFLALRPSPLNSYSPNRGQGRGSTFVQNVAATSTSPPFYSRLLAWCQGKGLQRPPPFMGKPPQDHSLLCCSGYTPELLKLGTVDILG